MTSSFTFAALVFCGFLFSDNAFAIVTPDWSEGFPVPQGGRANPYELQGFELKEAIRNGKIHTQIYPVKSTGLLVPYEPFRKFIEDDPKDPFRFIAQKFFHAFSRIKDINQVFRWVGLNEYPLPTDTGVYSVPYPNNQRPDHLMGFGLIERNGAQGFTISCAECHSSRLFGKTVLGLTNRFPRANETFVRAKTLAHFLSPRAFQHFNKATEAETDLLRELKANVKSVGAVRPLALGLDTSLAQTALSLNRRNKDGDATKSRHFEKNPRSDLLDKQPADSKPAVWWNLKYKNRWLSDGSVVSGNPIFTNLLWNEIGRGSDLQVLDQWLKNNEQVVQDLTTAVFSIEPPLFTDFFPAELIELQVAQRGEQIFNNRCAKCHGSYEKAWSLNDSQQFTKADLLKTVAVRYPVKTVVRDVGTDPLRWQGMKSLEKLNALNISESNGTLVKAQKGYVPPPLVGIWARWPYFHNNSAPNLCAVLTKSSHRPKSYYSGAAQSPETDFDAVCNGYPLGSKTPKSWKKKEHYFETEKPGLRNTGHDEGIFLENGKELLTTNDKLALIQYLQTL